MTGSLAQITSSRHILSLVIQHEDYSLTSQSVSLLSSLELSGEKLSILHFILIGIIARVIEMLGGNRQS